MISGAMKNKVPHCRYTRTKSRRRATRQVGDVTHVEDTSTLTRNTHTHTHTMGRHTKAQRERREGEKTNLQQYLTQCVQHVHKKKGQQHHHHHHTYLGRINALYQGGVTEISNLHNTLIIEEAVRRFQITVDDVVLVHDDHAQADVSRHAEPCEQRESSPWILDHIAQILTKPFSD
jgi:hypothetical protein